MFDLSFNILSLYVSHHCCLTRFKNHSSFVVFGNVILDKTLLKLLGLV